VSIASLCSVVDELGALLSGLDAEALPPGDAAEAVSVFVKGENLCAAGKAICASRAAGAGEHRRHGHSDPASWLAERSGGAKAAARDALDVGSSLSTLRKLDAALRTGELSPTKAQIVSEAASRDPSSEQALVDLARSGSVAELHEKAEAIKAASRSAQSDEERYEAIRKTRHLRTFTARDGAFLGRFSLTPDAGAKLLSVLQPSSDVFFEAARRAGNREPNEAYLADALVAAVTGEWPGQVDEGSGHGTDDLSGRTRSSGEPRRIGPPRATVICRVDLAALKRGALEPGETCEIPGVGPVPVSVARELFGDCFLKFVITKGVDVLSVCHYGRTITAHLRTALDQRDRCCVVPGCGRTFGLEYDHIVEFGEGGPTRLTNLCRLCAPHHALKTHKNYRIAGVPGAWEWHPPPQSGHVDDPPD
jgi:hypothetical protein